ncbi:D-alanine--D-alanine ligase [Bacteroidia bacterium]|nr:D-alanine--D-alanine ligase [Bacteroidia bacterium]GHT81214.1 D-alanine--D-alanine ligase [Bacteroidia bacterium]
MRLKNIAILYGGDSREAEISANSAANVRQWIDTARYNAFMLEVKGARWRCTQDGATLAEVDKNDFSIVVNGQRIAFDVALIMIHGTPGENGLLQSYFDLLQIPYTTCSAFVSALTFNKFACKAYLAQTTDVATAKSVLVCKEELQSIGIQSITKKIGLPLFVKPNNDGSSFGVSKVKTESELLPAIEKIFAQGSTEAIVEEFIAGTEVTNGAMRLNGKLTVLPITEIVSENEFFDYEAKYTGHSREITPARLDKSVYSQVQHHTSLIYNKLGCFGIVRVDYIIRDNIPYFLEINTVPGMSSASIIPQQVQQAGGNMVQTISDLIDTAYSNKK